MQVGNSNSAVGAAPATGTLRGTLYDAKVKVRSEKLIAEASSRFRRGPRTIGVICWLDGKIESADIFANPSLFAANREALIRSYSVDAQLAPSKNVAPVNMKACQVFLSRIVSARRMTDGSDKSPNRFKLRDRTVQGVEFGAGRFSGGFGGEGGGFSHGTYLPNDPNQTPPRRQVPPLIRNWRQRSGSRHGARTSVRNRVPGFSPVALSEG